MNSDALVHVSLFQTLKPNHAISFSASPFRVSGYTERKYSHRGEQKKYTNHLLMLHLAFQESRRSRNRNSKGMDVYLHDAPAEWCHLSNILPLTMKWRSVGSSLMVSHTHTHTADQMHCKYGVKEPLCAALVANEWLGDEKHFLSGSSHLHICC